MGAAYRFYKITVIMIMMILTVSGTSGVLVHADPADYKIEAQQKDGTWTPGLVDGYVGCNNIPFRLSATYKKNEGGTYQVNLGALYLDTANPKNKGVDYFIDFDYADPDGVLSGTPTVTEQTNVHNLPWAGGSGTGDTAVQPNGVTQLLYKLTFAVNDWSNNVQKTVTFYWKAHLALSASEWTGPPSAVLQVFADPPSGGTKTVNIKKPLPPLPEDKSRIIVTKLTVGGDGTFDYGTSGGDDLPSSFTITTTAGVGSVFYDVTAPGVYTVTESTPPEGWDFTSLACTPANSVVLDQAKATITFSATGQAVSCTFTNTGPLAPARAPVGGTVTTVNAYSILAPYLAMLGLVAAAGTAVAITRRSND